MTTSSVEHLPTAHYRSSDDERSNTAVLRAALAELEERGYAAASLQTIATRADLPLQTVFSHWRSKQHLVTDALRLLAREQPRPETGDVRSDLIQVTEALVTLLAHPGTAEILRPMLASSGAGHAGGATPRVDLLAERRAVLRRIVERGQRRQQLPWNVHPGLVADAVIGALTYRLFLANDTVDRHTAAQLVNAIVAVHTTDPG